MTTPQTYWLLIWGRIQCRVLGRHQSVKRTSFGYRVGWCQRCYAHRIERVAP